jgi:chromosome segregation ATPase
MRFAEQPAPIIRAPLTNIRHNISPEDSSVSSKRSNSSPASRSIGASSDLNSSSVSNDVARFKLKSKANDTPSNNGLTRRSRLPRPSSHTNINTAFQESDVRQNQFFQNLSSDNGGDLSLSFEDPFHPFENNKSNPNGVAVQRQRQQQQQLNWAQKQGQMAQGDIVRAEGHVPRLLSQNNSYSSHTNGNQIKNAATNMVSNLPNSSPSSTQSSPKQESITLNRSQLEEIIENRIATRTSELQEVISQQQKQISDLKFFQDLDLDKVPVDTNKATEISPQLEEQIQATVSKLSKVQAENTRLNQIVSQLREENINLQANLQACNPTMSSSDAYKKALRLQSDLLDSKNLLQEEVLRRERAETNLQCFRLESENELKKSHERVLELEDTLKERSKDLDDGIQIMKSLEEEIESVQEELEKERQHNYDLQKEFEEFEEEKNLLAKKLGDELELSKSHLKDMEERFDREKKELEVKCTELVEEVKSMKLKVLDMDEKKTRSIMELKKQHEERERNLQTKLEEKASEVRALEEKMTAMEEVVAMYHEKARAEIQEYAKQAEDANAQESATRERMQECLTKVRDTEKEIEGLLGDLEVMRSELEGKDKLIRELEAKNSEISESLKAFTSAKAKEHQLMRDKKKWVAIEKTLRDELRSTKEQHHQVESERQNLQLECDGLKKRVKIIENENYQLKHKLNMTETDLDKVYSALEDVERESTRRIACLEQELVRSQNVSTSLPSPKSSAELEELKSALKSKDYEIRRAQEAANAAMNEIESLRKQNKMFSNSGRPTNSQPLQLDQVPPAFDAFDTSDGIGQFENVTDLEWDEMDNMSTSRKVQSAVNSVTPDNFTHQRRSIENDAIRSYMRSRRRHVRSQQ